MPQVPAVESPDGPAMDRLCDRLRELSGRWISVTDWPGESLRLCGQAGVNRWFLPSRSGGLGWSEEDQIRGYLRLSEADLTTTFIITQYMGAIRRIASSPRQEPGQRWLERLVSGETFGTVGVSHLTTSGRHLGRPSLLAIPSGHGFVLRGASPWVTGAPHADVYVIGATQEDGREILAAVPSHLQGVVAGKGFDLIALSASCTDRVAFEDVLITSEMVLAGPIEQVMSSGTGGTTGGLQTSTLAIGLARAAVGFLSEEASRRDDLVEASEELTRELDAIETRLLQATGGSDRCDPSELRGDANRLVLRATQAAMTAAKGAGFVDGHPVGRWCRQALFFLVWSCPQNVAHAHLCELAFGKPT